jgi:hypothetical protein
VDRSTLTEAPRLEEGDRLFVSHDDDTMATACLNFGFIEHGYVNGFRMAADLAVDYVAAEHEHQDYLVFPAVFGYRQYLELRTKGLLKDASSLLDLPAPGQKLMSGHRLSPIWSRLEPLLVEIFGADSDQPERIRKCVAEFDALDPGSYAFRYATTNRGDLSLPTDLKWISLTNLRNVIAKIAATLDGLDVGLGVYLDQKAQDRSYLASEGRSSW